MSQTKTPPQTESRQVKLQLRGPSLPHDAQRLDRRVAAHRRGQVVRQHDHGLPQGRHAGRAPELHDALDAVLQQALEQDHVRDLNLGGRRVDQVRQAGPEVSRGQGVVVLGLAEVAERDRRVARGEPDQPVVLHLFRHVGLLVGGRVGHRAPAQARLLRGFAAGDAEEGWG